MSFRSGDRRLAAVACAAGLTLALLARSPAARADEPRDEAMAQSLFDAGRRLMEELRYEEACGKFEESNRLDPSAGTLLNWGKCLEAQGKTATAWVTYRRALALARANGQARQIEAGEGFVASIEPRLSKLTIDVARPVAGLVVSRSGITINDAARGVPIAVDPGVYEIVAEAPGYERWATRVEVGSNADVEVVRVPALVSTSRLAPPDERPPSSNRAAETGPSPLLVTGIVVGGVGIVAMGIGAAFGAMTLSDASQAETDPALCPANRCSAAGEAFIDDARDKALVSTLGLSLGSIAVAAGVTLTILSLTVADETVIALPLLGPSTFGIVLGGRL
jgi:hypothetical protein